jgi:hypothetical protein
LYKGFLRISKRYSEGNALQNTPLNPLSRGDLEKPLPGGDLEKPLPGGDLEKPLKQTPLLRGAGGVFNRLLTKKLCFCIGGSGKVCISFLND